MYILHSVIQGIRDTDRRKWSSLGWSGDILSKIEAPQKDLWHSVATPA